MFPRYSDGRPRLCIIAPVPLAASETFIEDHVRGIAPDQTLFLGLPHRNGAAAERISPHLRLPDSDLSARAESARWRRYCRFALGRYPWSLSGRQRNALLEGLQRHRPHSVLAEFGPTAAQVAPVCTTLGIPLFAYFHGFDASYLARKRLERASWRRLARAAAGFIFASSALARNLLDAGCRPPRHIVVPCGVDTTRFSPVPQTVRDSFSVLAVGRLVEKKAPLHLLRAFQLARIHHPHARLDVVGDGPLRDACRAFVAEQGLAQHVTLHGSAGRTLVQDLMQKASVFAQHSVTAANGDMEGTPVSILEAMASGLPVVSTRHSGIADAIEHEISGLLVDEHDIEGMAAALTRCLGDANLRARLGQAARVRVENQFSSEIQNRRLREFMGIANS